MSEAKTGAADHRSRTDRSLASERKKTDAEVTAVGIAANVDADRVIADARREADAVLLAQNAPEVSQAARAKTDERATEARDARRRALATLFALERRETDARLAAERALSDTQLASRDEHLAIVSHDLGTLMATIAVHAALLVRTAADSPEGVAADALAARARILQTLSVRATGLARDLADASAIDAGALSVARVAADGGAIVSDAAAAFAPVAAEKQVSLRAEVPDSPATAMLDERRILQLLANLLSNAIRHTPPGGRVAVTLRVEAACLRFAVGDTGSGMSPAVAHAAFQAFVRGPTTAERGLGLGLFISKHIAEAHGGRIWIETEEGRGTTVTFEIPRQGP